MPLFSIINQIHTCIVHNINQQQKENQSGLSITILPFAGELAKREVGGPVRGRGYCEEQRHLLPARPPQARPHQDHRHRRTGTQTWELKSKKMITKTFFGLTKSQYLYYYLFSNTYWISEPWKRALVFFS